MFLCIILYIAYVYVTIANLQKSTEFVCVDGAKIKVCNGSHQHPNELDQTSSLCYHSMCRADMFRCNCGGSSDESNCDKNGNSKTSEFRESIPMEMLANSIQDCLDKSHNSLDIWKKNFVCPVDTYRCNYGGCAKLETLGNGFNDCVHGSDESKLICDERNCNKKHYSNEVFCPPLFSRSATIKCTNSDGKRSVPCKKPLPVGTIANWECNAYYKPADSHQIGDYHSICLPDGTWNRDRLQCEPECGITAPLVTPLIVHGWISQKQKWPWHATLYSFQHGNWTFWCGGSLISEKAVLTAAHCVWSLKATTIKVGLGKHFRNFEKVDPGLIFDVGQIIMQPLYQDLVGNYGSDIAILVLKKSAKFSENIRPVCIDWNEKDFTRSLDNSTLGMIVGLGITEKDEYSKTLKATYLPVVPSTKCIEKQKRDFKKYVTLSTFCAGWQNGTGVCNGDSGGGLVFDKYKNKTWVLEGIVSVSPRRLGTSFCDTNYFTIFTKVGMYVDWIKSALNISTES